MVKNWSSEILPSEVETQVGFSLSAGPAGSLTLAANGFDGAVSVLKLEDLDGDGLYLDPSETFIFGSETYSGQIIQPHAVDFYEA